MTVKERNASDYIVMSLLMDIKFWPEVFSTYSAYFVKIYESMKKTGSLRWPILSFPNEVYDFLDGNGFMYDVDGDFVTIRRME